jgi:Domain of unknown function (DUF4394)
MVHPIEYLESRIAPATIIAATSNNELVTFDSDTPATVETISITGLTGTMGETLVGIDFRPLTGALYGFTVNSSSQGQLYRINPITGVATAVGTAFTDAGLTLSNTAAYGFDFNPVADRIRIVNSDGENLRVNPNDGTLAGVDSDLTAGSVIHASAYDRNFAQALVTTLFGIDVNTDQLVLQGSLNGTPNGPNGGVITNVGALGVNAVSASFDIENGTGLGFAVLQVGSATGLYTINLTTGAATSVGDVGTGTSTIVGMAVATEQVELVNARTARFTEADGDIVTIKITKGELTHEMFELSAGQNGGAFLRSLDLTAPSFAGTNVTITAKRGPDGGDKLAGVGYINATGNDLGVVKISGDLTQIDAGDNAGGLGLKSLSVDSFGRINARVPATDLISTSTIEGSLTKLSVKKDFTNVVLSVTDSTEGALGRIGSIVIGGSVVKGQANSGTISAEQIGTVRIMGNIQGGDIEAFDSIDSVTINGSLIGGSSTSNGKIGSGGTIGKIVIKGSIVGGSGELSGRIFAQGDIGSVTVNGSLIGGTEEEAGSISSNGKIGSVSIKGSMLGGSGAGTESARISATDIKKVTVGKSIVGIAGSSGQIFAENSLGTVIIGGSVSGSEVGSGRIEAATIDSVTIKGSLTGSNEGAGSIFADTSLDKVVINGNVVGDGSSSGEILVDEGSLGTVSIKGSIQGGRIFGSTGIDSVTVGGDVSSSNETAIGSGGEIGSVTIKGSMHSSPGSGGIFGDSLGKVTVNGDVNYTFIESDEGGTESIKIQGSLKNSTIHSNSDIGKISVGGDIVDALGLGSAIVSSGTVDSIDIKGSILPGEANVIISAKVLGSVKVGGDIAGTDLHRVAIAALGTQATSGTADLAIANLTVGGRVEYTAILAGYDGTSGGTLTPLNADAQIGKVRIGGDWVKSDLLAGVVAVLDPMFIRDYVPIAEVGEVDTIVASIASLTVKGSVIGTFDEDIVGAQSFAFVAEEIQSASINGKKIKLESGPVNDNVDGLDPLLVFGNTQDVRIREVGII